MREHKEIHSEFSNKNDYLIKIIADFNESGTPFGNQERNQIRLFTLNGLTLNVKSFKIPNLINQVAYRFFRKSKARRSFEYAKRLTELNIGTPQPIAYFEFSTLIFLKNSYYLSEHLKYDLTFRELTENLNYPNQEQILRAFTRFTFKLHENNVHFLDHSPGNTLIQKGGEDYLFYLVDLNRMEFKTLQFEERIKNFKRLTPHKSVVRVMSDEYAKLINTEPDKVFDLMWQETQNFQRKFHRKQGLKRKLKFWKN